MADGDIDVELVIEAWVWNTDSEHFTVAIDVSDTSTPPIPFGSLERFEQTVHNALIEHILGIKESWEMDKRVERPRRPVLKSEHKVCYNKLSGEPKQ